MQGNVDFALCQDGFTCLHVSMLIVSYVLQTALTRALFLNLFLFLTFICYFLSLLFLSYYLTFAIKNNSELLVSASNL